MTIDAFGRGSCFKRSVRGPGAVVSLVLVGMVRGDRRLPQLVLEGIHGQSLCIRQPAPTSSHSFPLSNPGRDLRPWDCNFHGEHGQRWTDKPWSGSLCERCMSSVHRYEVW